MQVEALDPLHAHVLTPAQVAAAIRPRVEESVQHLQEEGPLDREPELPATEQLLDGATAPGLLPEALEHQRRPDLEASGRRCGSLSMRRYHHKGFCEPGSGLEERLELARYLEGIQTAERRNHTLARRAAFPAVLHDLEVGAAAGTLGAEEHFQVPSCLTPGL